MSQTTEYNRSRVGVRVQTCYRGKERHRPSHCNYSKLTHRCPNSTYSRSCNTRVFIINLQVFDRWETGKSLDGVKSHLEYKGTKLSVYLILHFMAELPIRSSWTRSITVSWSYCASVWSLGFRKTERKVRHSPWSLEQSAVKLHCFHKKQHHSDKHINVSVVIMGYNTVNHRVTVAVSGVWPVISHTLVECLQIMW